MELRQYQIECLEIIKNMKPGSYLIQMATGLGKTIVFTNYINNIKGRCLIISHREELVNQPLKYISRSTGIEMGKFKSNNENVISSCISSLVRRYKKFKVDDFDTIIVDECFPAGTLINNIPIEKIRNGDIITSYNHNINKIENNKVLNTFKSIPKNMVIIKLINGEEIVCTGNHPIYTKRGYIPAIKLNKNDVLYRMQSESKRIKIIKKSKIQVQKNRACLLFKGMFKRILQKNIIRNNVKNKQEICIGTNEKKQSNEKKRNTGKSFKKIKRNRTLSKNTWWKWSGFEFSSIKIINSINKIKSLCRISNTNKNEKRHWFSNLLQNRYSFTFSNDSYRNRWQKSPCIRKTKSRQKENTIFKWVRVESVKIQKQTSDGTFGRLCKDGYVYNIEIENNNNYFVSNYLVHNCHHSAATSYIKVLKYFKPRLVLGFTATPNRADNKKLDHIFSRIIYKYDLLKGIKNNYLSNIYCKRVYVKLDLSKVRSKSDYQISDLEAELIDSENPKAIGEIYKQHRIGQTLIFGVTVKHCEEISKFIPGSQVISANTKNRAEILENFKNKKIPCIINCMIFTEGTDIPNVETIIMARPTKSETVYSQAIGRGTRLHPGKEKLLLIDCVGVSTDLNLCTAPTLLGIDYNDEKVKKDEGKIDLEGNLFDLPAQIEKRENHPDNWKINYKIVNIWANKKGYNLHYVNWFKHSDGSFSLQIKNIKLKTTPIDELGYLYFKNQKYEAQDFFDKVRKQLDNKYKEHKYIWDLSIMKYWGYKPATPKQLQLIKRFLPDFNTDKLNKLQANQILTKLMNK